MSKLEIDFKRFPTTRYQGSKRKILPWIYGHLKPLRFHTAIDVFGGTASVSYLLKKMGKQVTFNDSLRCNYLMGKVKLFVLKSLNKTYLLKANTVMNK